MKIKLDKAGILAKTSNISFGDNFHSKDIARRKSPESGGSTHDTLFKN
jgi:hypothetical protein